MVRPLWKCWFRKRPRYHSMALFTLYAMAASNLSKHCEDLDVEKSIQVDLEECKGEYNGIVANVSTGVTKKEGMTAAELRRCAGEADHHSHV